MNTVEFVTELSKRLVSESKNHLDDAGVIEGLIIATDVMFELCQDTLDAEKAAIGKVFGSEDSTNNS